MIFDNLLNSAAILPELVLAVLAMILLLLGAFNGDKSTRDINLCAVISLIAVGIVIIGMQMGMSPVIDPDLANPLQHGETVTHLQAFATYKMVDASKFVTSDIFSSIMKLMILTAAAFCLLISPGYLVRHEISRPEYPVLVMLSVLGMMLMVSASNFLVLYMGLELQSLALYVLAAFRRDTVKSSEAGLKYFVLGALASGLLLYGISLVYGFTGSLNYVQIADMISHTTEHSGVIVGLVFILAALAFKVSAAPFHMWTPDVYEGAPTTVTAFFSVVPKLAGMGLLMQVLFVPFAPLALSWQPLIAVMAALSMAIGAFGAIGQTNIKRLLAYSSIGHVGFALMALAAATPKGIEAVLMYLAFYVIMSLGAFSVVLMMRRDGKMVEQITDLSGVSRHQPGLAAAMAVLMFSMAGIPPMVGFFTKLYVFIAAIQGGLIWLAVIGALASVVGAYYYLRVIKIMYFDEPAAALDKPAGVCLSITLLVASVVTFAGAVLLTPLGTIMDLAALGLIQP